MCFSSLTEVSNGPVALLKLSPFWPLLIYQHILYMNDNAVQLSYIESVIISIKDNLEWSSSQSAIKSDNNYTGLALLITDPLPTKCTTLSKEKKCEMRHITHDMWHVTCDMWHVVGGERSLKILAPKLLWFVIYDILKIWRKTLTNRLTSPTQLMTKVLEEQPSYTGSVNNLMGKEKINNEKNIYLQHNSSVVKL